MLRVKTQPAVNYSIRLLKRQESKKKLKTHGKRLDTSGEQQSFPRLLLDNQAPFNNQRCRPCWPMGFFFISCVSSTYISLCEVFFGGGGGFLGGNSAHIFRVRNLVSPLHTTTFSTSHPPLACVQPARLSSAPSAGGSGLSGTKEKAIQELCAAR